MKKTALICAMFVVAIAVVVCCASVKKTWTAACTTAIKPKIAAVSDHIVTACECDPAFIQTKFSHASKYICGKTEMEEQRGEGFIGGAACTVIASSVMSIVGRLGSAASRCRIPLNRCLVGPELTDTIETLVCSHL